MKSSSNTALQESMSDFYGTSHNPGLLRGLKRGSTTLNGEGKGELEPHDLSEIPITNNECICMCIKYNSLSCGYHKK